MPFRFAPTDLPGVLLIEPQVLSDQRGFFVETYKESDFQAAGIPARFVQENWSSSTRGVLRGLHYQRPPKAQGKLVRVAVGEIFDVAVDLRPEAPTVGRWVGIVLSAENKRMLYVPPWCAHGFCVTSAEASVVYKVTEEYAPACEAGIRWDDPDLGIPWPIREPFVAPRDQALPRLREAVAVGGGGR